MHSITRQFILALLLMLPLIASAAPQGYQVAIEGMTCADCAQAITMALSKIPNIDKSSVKVSLKGNSATLKMNDADKNTQDLVKKAIEDSGYSVKSIETVPARKS